MLQYTKKIIKIMNHRQNKIIVCNNAHLSSWLKGLYSWRYNNHIQPKILFLLVYSRQTDVLCSLSWIKYSTYVLYLWFYIYGPLKLILIVGVKYSSTLLPCCYSFLFLLIHWRWRRISYNHTTINNKETELMGVFCAQFKLHTWLWTNVQNKD